MELTERERDFANRLCVALDVEDGYSAEKLTQELGKSAGYFKIPESLSVQASRSGFPILGRIWHASGADDENRANIFADYKFHDTPKAVYRGAFELSLDPSVAMFTVHVVGGEAMCQEALQGAYDATNGKRMVGTNQFYTRKKPLVIGVTELSTLANQDLQRLGINTGYEESILIKAELAKKWGLDGVVTPITMAGELERMLGQDFLKVIPGLSFGGIHGKDQKHTYTPEEGIRVCQNSLLIAGSAIIQSKDPIDTTQKVIRSMARN